MRIANKAVYDNINNNLSKVSRAMVEANNTISSGRKINDLSDDPVGLVTLLDLRSSIANIEQLERNITLGRSWLTMGEFSLTQTENVLVEANSLCVQMANGTNSAAERANAVGLVDGYLRQILSLANTQVAGRYIFSGTNTDTAPFAFDDETTPTQIIYSGNDTAFSTKIGRSLNVAVGRDGEEIFGDDAASDNMFETLIDLKTALQNDNVTGIESAMSALDTHMENVRNLVSDTGAKMIRMNVKENIVKDLDLNYRDRMSQIEDADIAEAIVDLKTKELAYQAALSSSAKVMDISLIDFL